LIVVVWIKLDQLIRAVNASKWGIRKRIHMNIYSSGFIIVFIGILIINESCFLCEVISLFKAPTVDIEQQIIRNRKYLRLSIAELIFANPLWLMVIEGIRSIGTLNVDNVLVLLIACLVAVLSIFHMLYWIPKITRQDVTVFRSPYNLMLIGALRFIFYLFFSTTLLFHIDALLTYSPILTIVIGLSTTLLGFGIQKCIRIR
jgi:hypothetical protein